MTHSGSKENPAEIVAPGDLDRAVARVWQPTPEQARAGNYKMAHVILGAWSRQHGTSGYRLPVTIETPLDRTRSGVGPDGTPWSVRMPAHYGYVKNTTGYDGDAVDVYVGSEAHQVHLLPVWIVDQVDADSKAFDEHKCFLGFPDVSTVRRTYYAAFSDGRGSDRTGAVVRMAFDEFIRWLDSGQTKKPLAYVGPAKSASAALSASHYCPATCPCRAQEKFGGFMTTPAAAAGNTANAPGLLARILGTSMKSMPAADRASIMADAALLASTEIGKADDLMRGGDDGGHPGRVEDLWDGPPDDHLKTGGGYGPGSTAAPGDVNVGPSQAASGNGAAKMEGEYSRHAPQYGVQRATEKLGRDLAGVKGAMKSVVKALEAFSMQIEALKASAATVPAAPDAAAITAMVNAAVAKALAPAVTAAIDAATPGIVAKAKKAAAKGEGETDKEKDTESGEGDEEEDEEDDEEAEQDESGSGVEIEIDTEVEDGDEGEDEAGKALRKSAARLRVLAKNRLKWAARRIAKADELEDGGKPKTAEHMRKKARHNFGKAIAYAEAAKALFPGREGPRTQALGKAIVKARKGIKAMPHHNQDKWPAAHQRTVGKSDTDTGTGSATAPAVVSQADLQRAVTEIGKAVEGQGLLIARMSDVFNAMAGQSRAPALPPVFALVKANGDELTAREAEIIGLGREGTVPLDDVDRAREVISNIRSRVLPPELIATKIARLSQPVQAILQRQAA